MTEYAITFNGRWQPSNNPSLIDGFGFQDIQNMRNDQQGLIGVKGHTPINTTVWNTTYKYPLNGFQFKKDQPEETHVLVYATDSSGAGGRVYENTTAIPSQGNFSSSVWHTDATGAGLGRFSMAPQGNMIYANGSETLIWGGDESRILGFKIYDPGGSFSYDYYDQVSNTLTDSDNVAVTASADADIDTNTVLMLHNNGASGSTAFIDDSGSAHTVTAIGDAQIDTTYKKFGTGSALFDITGDYLSIPDSNDWNFGNSAFTIDTWVRFDSLVAAEYIYYQGSGTTNYLGLYIGDVGNVAFYHEVDDVEAVYITTTSGLISTDTWYHIALTRNSTDTWNIWIDGVQKASVSDSSSLPDYASAINIGADFDGWIDELRVSKGVSRYDSSFTPPASEYTGTGKTYMYLGSYLKLDGFKMYIESGNLSAGTMSVNYWNGASWQAATTLVDGTASGGASLSQTGTVSFDSTSLTAELSLVDEIELYWYQIEISECDAGVEISYITGSAEPQAVSNIWDGSDSVISSCYVFDDDVYTDYTAEAQDDSTTTVVVLDSLGTATDFLLIGSVERLQAFNFSVSADKENRNSASVSVSYWDGGTWQEAGNVNDSTNIDGVSLAKSGAITFDSPEKSDEFLTAVETEAELYYYKIAWTANLDGETEIYHITGISSHEKVKNYKFPTLYGNRTFLVSDESGEKNTALYSAENAPYIFNGSDSGKLYFGSGEKIVSTAHIYNVFNSTGYDQLIVIKENETYRVFGDDPDTWSVQQMSGNIGCISPLSVAVCEVTSEEQGERHVAIWQGSSGVYMCDGAIISPIHADIRDYWDPDNDLYIPVSRQSKSIGWFDSDLMVYKLLITSGSGAYHNVELEYSLKNGSWTKLYRENGSGANPLQTGFIVKTDEGKRYTYGATNEGTVYRLEDGYTWNGTGINQYVWTKNHFLDSTNPLMKDSIIKYTRFMFENKISATESMTIQHYGNDILTVSGTNMQRAPSPIALNSGPFDTQSCIMGPFLTHSFKVSSTISSVADGMELYGLGLYYESYDRISNN
jgi:hypothetical protein